MNCECINEMEERLKEKNLTITSITLAMPSFKTIPIITLAWRDKDKAPKGKRNNPPPLLASHCPLCGKPCD